MPCTCHYFKDKENAQWGCPVHGYRMSYAELLKNAPPHDTPAFLDYIREHNEVLWEDDNWLVIENHKYGHPTAFAKIGNPALGLLIRRYGDKEWKVKPKEKRSVTRFHIHIL